MRPVTTRGLLLLAALLLAGCATFEGLKEDTRSLGRGIEKVFK